MFFGGDFVLHVGTTSISFSAHAVHGTFVVQTIPRDMGRVGIKGEG